MSRRTKIVIVVIVLLVIAGVAVWYFFFRAEKKGGEEGGGTFPTTEDTAFPREDDGKTTILPEELKPRLRLLYKEPQAGAVIGKKSGAWVARFVDVATGNVFENGLTEGEPERLTHTTIPKVYEAVWRPSGAGVALRYLKEDGEDIETFSGTLRGESGASGLRELAGSFFPRDITSFAVAPDGSRAFYIREEDGGAVGVTAGLDAGGKREVWRSPLREWNALWIKSDTIALQSKPSARAAGMLLYVNPSTLAVERVLSGAAGFTALPSPTGALVAASEAKEAGIAFSLFEKTTRNKRTLPFTTLPEKCAWNKRGTTLYCAVPKLLPEGSYPDSWYQGLIAFNDGLWSVDALTGITRFIADPRLEAGAELDIITMAVSEDESYLVFADKATQTLWSFRLTD
jgi:hypothetical protein